MSANTSNKELESARADYVAAAGLQNAMWRLQNNACMGDVTIPDTVLGNDRYSATITGAAAGTFYTLAADQDAWIRSDDPTRNNGTSAASHIRQETGIVEHALTRFDLAALPANAQVLSAVAWFKLKATKEHPEGPISVHEIAANWSEDSVTWESFAGAYRSAVVGMIPVQDTGNVWISINLTGLVQAWVNGQPNHGILMQSSAEGVHGEYLAREDSTNPPRLEVVVGSGAASPVAITASGVLANGVTRTLGRPVAAANQPPVTHIFRPDSSDSEDAELWDQEPSTNYGDAAETWVSSASNDTTRTLLRFNLGAIPAGAKVLDASLSLYRQSGSGTDQPVSAHRIANSWSEASVTWNSRETGTNWDTAGGDFDSTAVVTTPVGPANERYEWNITTLAQGWVDGSYPNYGVALVAAIDGMPGERFYTSDQADPDKRPGLSVTYACECGSPCMAPQGSGNILMVVISPTTLVEDDQQAKDLFESWGYTVSVISESANQSSYDSAVAANDVVFISETVNSNSVGTRLVNAKIGVVSQDGDYNADLGFATGSTLKVGADIDVTATDHYITRPFRVGPLPIYAAGMQQLVTTGALTAGQKTLAAIGGDASLVAVDQGDALEGGGNAAGRRVVLPLGTRSGFDWDYLTNEGRLIVQRSLDWGMKADISPAGNLLLVVVNPGNLTSQEQAKKALIEGWGYTVSLVDESDSQGVYDTALAANDVVFVTEDVSSGNVGSKLNNASIGVVIEETNLADDLGFSGGINWDSGTDFDIDNTHYITSPLTSGNVILLSSFESLAFLTGATAPGLDVLGIHDGNISIAALEGGAALSAGGTAPGRRVLLPWGGDNMDVNYLNADGLTVFQRALEWGAGAGDTATTAPVAHWKLDETSGTTAQDAVGNNDGLLNGNGTWTAGEIDGGLALDYADGQDYVDIPNTSGLENVQEGNYTLAAWFRPNSTPPGSGSDNDANYGILIKAGWHNGIFFTNDNRFAFEQVLDGDSGVGAVSANSFSPGDFYHVAGVIDRSAGTQSLYVNGQLEDTRNFTPGAAAREYGTEPWRIGVANPYYSTWGWQADGVIDDVRIYDTALSAQEITEIAAEGGNGGPVAHWKLDETTGSTAVDSVGGHDGTWVNGPASATGKIDGALDFDGSNDYVNVPQDGGLSLTDTMTFTAWVNASSYGAGYQTIIAKDGGGSGSNYYFGTWQDELVFGFFAGGLFREVFTTGLNLQAGTWHHLGATFDDASNTVRLYADGSEVLNGTLGFSPSVVAADLTIGRSPDGERWRGLLDDVRIYDQVLGDSEIAELASASAGGPYAHWKLDDGTGVTAVDSIGGHDGTLINGPAWVAGQIGDALDFDGSNDLVTVPHQAIFTQAPMTVSAWFKLNTLPTTRSEHGTIIDKRHTADPWASWTLYVNKDLGNKIRFQIRDSSETGYWLDSAASAVANTWYHVVGTIDESHNAKLFVNGVLEPDDDNIGSLFSSNDEIRIGAGWSGGNRLDGVVDDVRFYDRDLSAAEISGLFTAGTGGGGGGGGGGGCSGTFRDEFNAISYAGSDGTEAWASDWLEINEDGNVTSGDEKVDDNDSDYHLQVRDNDGGGEGVQREANLSAYTSATFSFEYRRDGFDNSNDYVTVDVSDNGGSSWTELDRFPGPGTDSSYVNRSYDISAYLSSNTRIRFLTSPDHGSGDEMYIDNVEISASGCANP